MSTAKKKGHVFVFIFDVDTPQLVKCVVVTSFNVARICTLEINPHCAKEWLARRCKVREDVEDMERLAGCCVGNYQASHNHQPAVEILQWLTKPVIQG